MGEKRYRVVIERTVIGFSAYSLDVAGCAAAGGGAKEETHQSLPMRWLAISS